MVFIWTYFISLELSLIKVVGLCNKYVTLKASSFKMLHYFASGLQIS